ncbi:hypothetical protein OIU84_000110 [Salix udensis]|uniref:Endonuclease/exonuclease/phosphatase domain-containing protein n=1 Tax=Salix udensis TaxID=889485 RepID=A0AAD6L554_9ROSI|nr:hypothetical protein OIU84_000110 [Salix udensis]
MKPTSSRAREAKEANLEIASKASVPSRGGKERLEMTQEDNQHNREDARVRKGKVVAEDLCKVGTIGSLLSHSQSTHEEVEGSETNNAGTCSDEPSETSPMASIKVRKKKGGKNKLSLISLMETKVATANLRKMQDGLELSSWGFVSNVEGNEAVRIVVGWDPTVYNVQCIHTSKQWITCRVNSNGGLLSLPWLLMGDFNATMKASDSEGEDPNWTRQKQEFGQCIQETGLHSIPYRGIKYTWNNGRVGEDMILKKLDWIIGNPALTMKWPDAHGQFLPRSGSDHSAMLMHFRRDQLYTKLQWVKASLTSWHKHNRSHISNTVRKAREDWDRAQERLDNNPISMEARLTKRQAAIHYQKLSSDEESFFRQKSRIQWLMLGDRNTSFFPSLHAL